MSTRCLIGRMNADGTVTSIYCHSDGYPEYTGKMLTEHYRDDAKVDALLALGNLSILKPEIGQKHDRDLRLPEHKNWCQAYSRDMNYPEDQSAFTDANRHDYVDTMSECTAEFVYLWDGSGWRVSDGGAFRRMKEEILH